MLQPGGAGILPLSGPWLCPSLPLSLSNKWSPPALGKVYLPAHMCYLAPTSQLWDPGPAVVHLSTPQFPIFQMALLWCPVSRLAGWLQLLVGVQHLVGLGHTGSGVSWALGSRKLLPFNREPFLPNAPPEGLQKCQAQTHCEPTWLLPLTPRARLWRYMAWFLKPRKRER